MISVINEVANQIAQRREDWSGFLLSTYVLAHKDRIGHYGSEFRGGLPAIWGHSYVRTYYMWANTPPPARELMEGGIATTYYVVNSLGDLLQRAGTRWREPVLSEITTFFSERTKSEGVGVRTIDPRGYSQIMAHLRHTCFGYLIMADLASAPGAPAQLRKLVEISATALAKALSKDELLRVWVKESWPVGGIASYIAARDHLYASEYSYVWPERERRLWPDVRERMLDALAQLSSAQLSEIGATKEEGKRGFDEHYPYWHPIKDAAVLRLHSTLGCLSLVGKDLAAREICRKRIEDIVSHMRRQLETDKEHAPRFTPDGPPSISAACAMLKMILGNWYEPSEADREFIVKLIEFIGLRWKDPAVYTDYWTEFTAPLLRVSECFGGEEIPQFVLRGERILDLISLPVKDLEADHVDESDKEVINVLDTITPSALGLPRTLNQI